MISRYHSPAATLGPNSAYSDASRLPPATLPPLREKTKITAFTATSEVVTTICCRPDRCTSRKVRTGGAPFTHSGHWNPTGAVIMQRWQIGRSQRVQRTPAVS